MRLRTDDEMQELMKDAIAGVFKVLNAQDNLRVPEADNIIDMIYCYFLNNSCESIPQNRRVDYIKNRMITLSMKLAHATEDIAGLRLSCM